MMGVRVVGGVPPVLRTRYWKISSRSLRVLARLSTCVRALSVYPHRGEQMLFWKEAPSLHVRNVTPTQDYNPVDWQSLPITPILRMYGLHILVHIWERKVQLMKHPLSLEQISILPGLCTMSRHFLCLMVGAVFHDVQPGEPAEGSDSNGPTHIQTIRTRLDMGADFKEGQAMRRPILPLRMGIKRTPPPIQSPI